MYVKKVRCRVCAQQFPYDEHTAALAARCGLPKKVYDAVERELDLHSRAAASDELDEDGNPAVCPLCTAKAVKKVKERADR